MDLSPPMKTAATLGALAFMLVVGTVWGVAQVGAPFPGRAEPAVCVSTSYDAGDRLYPQDVTVSVLNASGRIGLAGRTMTQLTEAGFAEGDTANAPSGTSVERVAIWTRDATSPAVLLVRSRLGQAEVVETPEPGAPGIVVVVGDGMYDELFAGRPSIVAETDVIVCGPEV